MVPRANSLSTHFQQVLFKITYRQPPAEGKAVLLHAPLSPSVVTMWSRAACTGQDCFCAFYKEVRAQITETTYPINARNCCVSQTVSVEWHHSKPWRLATGSHDKTVRIWDLNEETATKRDKMPGHRGKQTTMEQTLSPSLTISSPAAVRESLSMNTTRIYSSFHSSAKGWDAGMSRGRGGGEGT